MILIIVLRGVFKRRGDYQFFYETETSKQQLANAEKNAQAIKEKKELKKKIAESKAKGESFIELEKEYNEKFGKNAKSNIEDNIETAEKYESILADKKTEEENSNE